MINNNMKQQQQQQQQQQINQFTEIAEFSRTHISYIEMYDNISFIGMYDLPLQQLNGKWANSTCKADLM